MGIAAARIWLAQPSKERKNGLILYGIQLIVNFFWSIILFNRGAYGVALSKMAKKSISISVVSKMVSLPPPK